jgi:filamentous hemagglutinin family protein
VAALQIAVARGGQIASDNSFGPGFAHTFIKSGQTFVIAPAFAKPIASDLVYSFSQFNLQSGETADFSSSGAAGPISNVIARVTGGPAFINGTLESALGTSGFFFVDSAGVTLGRNSILDIPGSFTVSTADSMRLADGVKVLAAAGALPILTSPGAAAFGFLSPLPAPAVIRSTGGNNGIGLRTNGTCLSVVAGPVQIAGGKLVALGAGRVNLVAMDSPGRVHLDSTNLQSPTQIQSAGPRGDISLSLNNQTQSASQISAGQIVIRGGNLAVAGGSFIQQISNSNADGSATINLTGDLSVSGEGSQIFQELKGVTPGGPTSIHCQSVQLSGGGEIYSLGDSGSQGDLGPIAITAQQVAVTGGSVIDSVQSGAGASGDVSITAADSIRLAHATGGVATGLYTRNPAGSGAVQGNIFCDAPVIRISNGAYIETNGQGTSDGGKITVVAPDQLIIDGHQNVALTGITARLEITATSTATGGAVSVQAGDVTLSGGGTISTTTRSPGDAGPIDLNVAGNLTLAGDSAAGTEDVFTGVFARATNQNVGAGDGGIINANVDGNLALTGGAQISTRSFGPGSAGKIVAQAAALDMNGGIISSKSGGGGRIAYDQDVGVATIGPSTNGNGPAGAVTINVTGPVLVDGGGRILAKSVGDGRAGHVAVTAGSLTIQNHGTISAESTGSGSAGDVTAAATAGDVSLSNGADISVAAAHNTGGQLLLTSTNDISLTSGSSLSARAAGPTSDGGNIHIFNPAILSLDDSRIIGRAGRFGGIITIDPQLVTLNHDSVINGKNLTGNLLGHTDELVIIQSQGLLLSDDSAIKTNRGVFSIDEALAGTLASLPPSTFGGGNSLVPACTQMTGANTSSFVQTGNGGPPPEPGGWLPALQAPSPGNGGTIPQ